MYLDKGIGTFRITSNTGVFIDQIILNRSLYPDPEFNARIEFVRNNPSKYTIQPVGNTDAFFINFSENYSDKWQMWDGKTPIMPMKSHGFSNVYYIQEANVTNSLIVEYSDQKYVFSGLIISTAGYFVVFILIVFHVRPRHRRRYDV